MAWVGTPVFGVLLHALHHLLVLGGLVVLVVLLWSTRPSAVGAHPDLRSGHDRRVEALRAAAADGRLATVGVSTLAPDEAPAPDDERPLPTRVLPAAVPVALVSSAAAAGVHAAAGPAHLGEGVLVGGFFVVTALAQLGWAVLVLARGAERRLLGAGIALDAAVVALWLATRTVGLPFGLAPVEAVGPWDVAATAWELASVAGCVVALGSGSERGGSTDLVDVAQWPTAARGWLAGSILVMVLLATSGSPT